MTVCNFTVLLECLSNFIGILWHEVSCGSKLHDSKLIVDRMTRR